MKLQEFGGMELISLGIYEKALPQDISWKERLEIAKKIGFDYVELSIDETDERIARLTWSKKERQDLVQTMSETKIPILSMCLSAHRRYPFGSNDLKKRKKALEIMQQAIDLASDLGVRTIQIAGYDVYYEEKTVSSREFFIRQLKTAVHMAEKKGVMLSVEIMDDPFINSITKFLEIKKQIPSPWLQVYPDIGNLSAWPENDPGYELEKGISHITNVHLKDTLAVKGDFPGKFKEVVFGEGCVDFKGCLATLKRLNYQGPFLIEMWSGKSQEPIKEIEKAYQFLLPILKEVGYEHESKTND